MAEPTGLRGRKKQRTRRALIETGLRLFDERGFDAATVADICESAELSPATFYTHFRAKEDLVFADQPRRMEAGSVLMAERVEGETLETHLLRVVHTILHDGRWDIAADEDLTAIRARLITTVPALRAISLRWLFDSQHEWSLALARAFPEELDDFTAHALVGSVTGAMISAGIASLDKPEPPSEAAMRAARIAVRGVGAPAP